MSKGDNQRSNKEAKKPKKIKPKISGTADSNVSKVLNIGAKKKGK